MKKKQFINFQDTKWHVFYASGIVMNSVITSFFLFRKLPLNTSWRSFLLGNFCRLFGVQSSFQVNWTHPYSGIPLYFQLFMKFQKGMIFEILNILQHKTSKDILLGQWNSNYNILLTTGSVSKAISLLLYLLPTLVMVLVRLNAPWWNMHRSNNYNVLFNEESKQIFHLGGEY